jgi:hypothetical protein
MLESDPKPLAGLLFGSAQPEVRNAEEELAKIISALFQAQQAKLHDGASFGTPSAKYLKRPCEQP